MFIKTAITNLHLFSTEFNDLSLVAVKQLRFIPKTIALIQVNKVIPVPFKD